MKRVSKSAALKSAAKRAPGYLDEIMRVGEDLGNWIELSDADFDRIRREFGAKAPFNEVVKSLGGSLARWGLLGFPTVERVEFERRLSICGGCPHWSGNRCVLCGCYGSKAHLETEHCPELRW